jgi:CDGSH-type Zn-finger protein/uncharacterized Fe-S cluster protein YjdI
MSDQQKFQFKGEQIDVEWDGRLCIHIAECGQSEGDVFVSGRQPWCMPDVANVEEVVDIVERCPSGALTYQATQQELEECPESVNTVVVTYNGPYFVRGDLQWEDASDDMPGIAFRAALCRCGQSANKPFCDNSHEKHGFRDYGAIGSKGAAVSGSGGQLLVKPIKDGPLMLKGNLSMINGSGRQAWTGDSVALCRCGASKNKPFCDGSHMGIVFKSG